MKYRTTVVLNEELAREAMAATGAKTVSDAIEIGLRILIADAEVARLHRDGQRGAKAEPKARDRR